MSTNLTPRQKQILQLMLDLDDLDAARFFGGTRGFSVSTLRGGGLVIRCYQIPEFWLASRGLIAEVQTNEPGRWYRLTDQGRAAAERIRKNFRRGRGYGEEDARIGRFGFTKEAP